MRSVIALLSASLGERTHVPEEPRSDLLLSLVFGVGALAMYLDTRQTFRPPPAEDTWTFFIYFTIPLCLAVGWELSRAGRSLVVPAIVGTLAGAAAIARVGSEDLARALAADPTPLLGAAALGALLLLLEAWRQGVSVASWGIGLGDWRWWGPRCLGALVGVELMVVAAVWAFPDFRAEYPDYVPARTDLGALLWYQAWLGLYMFAWEGYFRGMLLWGLARRGDALFAIFTAAVPFFLLHWHKPEVEMLASFVGSVGAGWFCLRARSFLPLWLLHWAMNLSMEATCFAWNRLGAG